MKDKKNLITFFAYFILKKNEIIKNEKFKSNIFSQLYVLNFKYYLYIGLVLSVILRRNCNKIIHITDSNFLHIETLNSNLRTAKEF